MTAPRSVRQASACASPYPDGPGAQITDVGAGDGFYSVRIARAVGPSGRAVAVDISESALKKLGDRAARDGAAVDVVQGAADDPHLPEGRFDAVLIHNAYHEMTEHEAMPAHIHAALEPEGRLVLAEPMHDSSRGLRFGILQCRTPAIDARLLRHVEDGALSCPL